MSKLLHKACKCCFPNKEKDDTPLSAASEVPDLPIRIEKSVIPAPEQVEAMNVSEIQRTTKEAENIYGLALNLMQNYVGQPSYPFLTQQKQLYPYILSLCKELDRQVVQENYALEKLEEMHLFVSIKEASIAHPMYTDFKEIFCKIIVDGGIEYKSSSRESSKFLQWNEHFILPLDNYPDEVLRIEMWAVMPDKLQTDALCINDTFKQLVGRNFLIGDIIQPIKELPCYAQETIWSLKQGPQREHTRGQVKLSLLVSAKPGKDHFYYVYMYMHLLMLAYEHNLGFRESTAIWDNWLQILPNEALTLLQQLAVQHGIKANEQCVCSWIAAVDLRMKGEKRVSFYLLHTLLRDLYIDIADDPIAGYLKNAFINSIYKFASYLLGVLEKLHDTFPVEIDGNAQELYYLLECMNRAAMRGDSNYANLYPLIQAEAKQWYLKVIREKKNELRLFKTSLICKALMQIIVTFYKYQMIIDDVFIKAWNISYTNITYGTLDKVLVNIIKPIVQHITLIVLKNRRGCRIQDIVKHVELLHVIRKLVTYIIKDLPSNRLKLYMDDYSNWFGEDFIFEWFLICTHGIGRYINQVIKIDRLERLNDDVWHGSSASEVVRMTNELILEVWLRLSWEDQYFTYGPMTTFIQRCLASYVVIMEKQIKEHNFFCNRNLFEVKPKLCVALNSAMALFHDLHAIKEKIAQELLFTEEKYGFTILNPLIQIDSELHIHTAHLLNMVTQKISESVRKCIDKIMRSTRRQDQSKAVAEISTFVASALHAMHQGLEPDLFYIVLRHLWMMVVMNCKIALERKPTLFQMCRDPGQQRWALHQAFCKVEALIYYDGRGLSGREMNNLAYPSVKRKFENANLTSN